MNKDSDNKFLFDPAKVNEALKSAKSMEDLFAEGGALLLMLKNSIERMLKAEHEDHLGCPIVAQKTRICQIPEMAAKKFVKTTTGKVDLDIPRYRDGSFEPKVVSKYEGVSSKLEEQIISMYSKGMATRLDSDRRTLHLEQPKGSYAKRMSVEKCGPVDSVKNVRMNVVVNMLDKTFTIRNS